MAKEYKYSIKISNVGVLGFRWLILELSEEFNFVVDEYWAFKKDMNVITTVEPSYSLGSYVHTIVLYTDDKRYVKFAEHLIREYAVCSQHLEDCYLID